MTRGRENDDEEEVLVVGGGDMYLQQDENVGTVDTHIQSYAYMHSHIVCVCAAAVAAEAAVLGAVGACVVIGAYREREGGRER